ncbi:hypothetical protein SDC9_160128 [bioreactor metagenome]|uniref:Uncharacterized protein n=1 Tax=bioreactor metagenome TaxID=1076179 RepID=A0A645FEI5_9ZZZZ
MALFDQAEAHHHAVPLQTAFHIVIHLQAILLQPYSPFFMGNVLYQQGTDVRERIGNFDHFPIHQIQPVFLIQQEIFPIHVSVADRFLRVVDAGDAVLHIFSSLLQY